MDDQIQWWLHHSQDEQATKLKVSRQVVESGLLTVLPEACKALNHWLVQQQQQQQEMSKHHANTLDRTLEIDAVLQLYCILAHVWPGKVLYGQALAPAALPVVQLAWSRLKHIASSQQTGAGGNSSAAGASQSSSSSSSGRGRHSSGGAGNGSSHGDQSNGYAPSIKVCSVLAAYMCMEVALGNGDLQGVSALLAAEETHMLLLANMCVVANELHKRHAGLSQAPVAVDAAVAASSGRHGSSTRTQQQQQQVPAFHEQLLAAMGLGGLQLPLPATPFPDGMGGAAVWAAIGAGKRHLQPAGVISGSSSSSTWQQQEQQQKNIKLLDPSPAHDHLRLPLLLVLVELIALQRDYRSVKLCLSLISMEVQSIEETARAAGTFEAAASGALLAAAAAMQLVSPLLLLAGPSVLPHMAAEEADEGSGDACGAYYVVILQQLVCRSGPIFKEALLQDPLAAAAALEVALRAAVRADLRLAGIIDSGPGFGLLVAAAVTSLIAAVVDLRQANVWCMEQQQQQQVCAALYSLLLTALKCGCVLHANDAGALFALGVSVALGAEKVAALGDNNGGDAATANSQTAAASSSDGGGSSGGGSSGGSSSGSSSGTGIGSSSSTTVDLQQACVVMARCFIMIVSALGVAEQYEYQQRQRIYSVPHKVSVTETPAALLYGCGTRVSWLRTQIAQQQLHGLPEAASGAQQQLQQQADDLVCDLDRAVELCCSSQGDTNLKTPAHGDALACRCASVVGAGFAQQLQDYGQAVCVQLPLPCCCNNPVCSNMAKLSEQQLVGGKGCLCGGCKVARYCSAACQKEHWPQHKAVCKRMRAA